jgi:enoyl-[acyl-carrier protein] reductase I
MLLKGKRGLVVGIANEHSIAYGCAKAFRENGAELAITYLNAKAEPYVRPLAEALDSPIIVPCDVREPEQLEAVFTRIREQWGVLDFVLHSIAYAPKEDLQRRVVDCSQAGFSLAMDVSCHSSISMARLAEPVCGPGDFAWLWLSVFLTPPSAPKSLHSAYTPGNRIAAHHPFCVLSDPCSPSDTPPGFHPGN